MIETFSSVSHMFVGRPCVPCFPSSLPSHLCFSTCSPSESDCESEPAQTPVPKWGRIVYKSKYWNWYYCNESFCKITGYTLVRLTYQLLPLGKISSGCVCNLCSSEPVLYRAWCYSWWSDIGSLGMGKGPGWGVLTVTLLALLSKTLQERFYSYNMYV